MMFPTDSLTAHSRTALAEMGEPAETLAALRRQMTALEEQLTAVNQQQAELRAALHQLLARFPDAGPGVDTGAAEPLHQRCAEDLVRVLREAGRPLGTLEILEEMAARHLSWRESTVRHVLADLKNEGIVREGESERPRSYVLVRP